MQLEALSIDKNGVYQYNYTY